MPEVAIEDLSIYSEEPPKISKDVKVRSHKIVRMFRESRDWVAGLPQRPTDEKIRLGALVASPFIGALAVRKNPNLAVRTFIPLVATTTVSLATFPLATTQLMNSSVRLAAEIAENEKRLLQEWEARKQKQLELQQAAEAELERIQAEEDLKAAEKAEEIAKIAAQKEAELQAEIAKEAEEKAAREAEEAEKAAEVAAAEESLEVTETAEETEVLSNQVSENVKLVEVTCVKELPNDEVSLELTEQTEVAEKEDLSVEEPIEVAVCETEELEETVNTIKLLNTMYNLSKKLEETVCEIPLHLDEKIATDNNIVVDEVKVDEADVVEKDQPLETEEPLQVEEPLNVEEPACETPLEVESLEEKSQDVDSNDTVVGEMKVEEVVTENEIVESPAVDEPSVEGSAVNDFIMENPAESPLPGDEPVSDEVTTVVEEIPVENVVLEVSMTEEAQCPLEEVSLEQEEATTENILSVEAVPDMNESLVENAVLDVEEAQCPLEEVSLAAEQQEASVEEILVENAVLDVEEEISSVEAQCPLGEDVSSVEEISLTEVAETLVEASDNNVEVFETVLESKEENVVSEAVVENSTEEVAESAPIESEESSYIGEFPDDETMKAAVQQLKKELLEVVAEHAGKISEENEQMNGVVAEEVVGDILDDVVEENQEPLVIDEELFERIVSVTPSPPSGQNSSNFDFGQSLKEDEEMFPERSRD